MNRRTLIGVFGFVLVEFVLRASGQPPTQPQPPPAADAARGAVQVLDELPSGALNIDRWAVIVGISKYKDERWNLKYADRDADELSELLQKGTGGGFAKDHILKLTNEQATTGAIQKALRSFLKKPGKDDVVLLYFSCHGSTDPDRPELVYILTYDTDPDDISGTALPMREINASLQEYLQARRVVILADTCHSAAIGGSGRRAAGESDAAAVNTFLQNVSRTRRGTALLTSAEANEVALEDARWGGGHGVFTYFLLEGMRGAAERGQSDGVVTLGELFEYVRDGVLRETGNKQHPSIGTTTFDRRFPMAVTGGARAQLHDKIGRQLYELGRVLNEPRPFEAAAQHLGEAQRLYHLATARDREAEAYRGRGLALLALDDDANAARALSAALERGGDKAPPDTPLLLGIARARLAMATQGDPAPALSSLREFVARNPADPMTPWAAQVISRLKTLEPGGGRRYALVIGVGTYRDPALHQSRLGGPANDVVLVRDTLKQTYGLVDSEIVVLGEGAATYDAVTREIRRLRDTTTTSDSVLIYLSGMDSMTQRDKFGFFLYDSTLKERERLLDFRWLLDELGMSKAPITVIADAGCPQPEFGPVLARGVRPPHSLVLPSNLGDVTYETPRPRPHGVFTFLLFTALAKSRHALASEILDKVAYESSREGFPQSPLAYGELSRSFLFPFNRDPTSDFRYEIRPRRLESVIRLEELYKGATGTGATTPGLHAAFGLAFLERGKYASAAEALATAVRLSPGGDRPEPSVALGEAHIRQGMYGEAVSALEGAIPRLAPEAQETVRRAADRVRKLSAAKVCAVLVGIDHYERSDLKPAMGAVDDVESVRRVLGETFGTDALDVTVLKDRDATREAILKAFRQAVKRSTEVPTLFYFSGFASYNGGLLKAILSSDSRSEVVPGITVVELAGELGKTKTNLVTIIDPVPTGPVARDLGPPPGSQPRNVGPVGALVPNFRLGRFCILGAYTPARDEPDQWNPWRESMGRYMRNQEPKTPRGLLTRALLGALNRSNLASLSYAKWAEAAGARLNGAKPVVLGEDRDERVFSNTVVIDDIAVQLKQGMRAPFKSLAARLGALAETRPDLAAELYLDLGIARAAAGDYDAAVAAFDRSRTKTGIGQNQLVAEGPLSREFHYHLGRILYESRKNLSRAVSELDEAVRLEPENARAHYYRGEALRRLIEENLLTKARDDLKTYLDAGVPVSRYADIDQFVQDGKGGVTK